MLSSQTDGGIHQTNYYFHGQGGKQFFIWLQLLKKMDSAIHWIIHYPVDNAILVFLLLISWIAIYLVDSAIQLLNNQGQLEFFWSTGAWLGWNFFLYQHLPANTSSDKNIERSKTSQALKNCVCCLITCSLLLGEQSVGTCWSLATSYPGIQKIIIFYYEVTCKRKLVSNHSVFSSFQIKL